MPADELPLSVLNFISRYVRSVEQLEILLLFSRERDATWSVQQAYEAILSTPQSVERWLDEFVRHGLLEKLSTSPSRYRCCAEEGLVSQLTALAQLYQTTPVRVIEAIYKRDTTAAKSFADAFKLNNPDPNS